MIANENHRPKPSRASRSIPKKTKGSIVGQLTFGEEHGQGQCLVFESKLERDVALVSIYAPGVVDIEDQVGPVHWVDATGKSRKHTFDFKVTTVRRSGKTERVALVVKPERRAQTAKFRDQIERVARSAVPTFADKVCIVTEANVCEKSLTRAIQLHGARIPVPEIDTMLGEISNIKSWTVIRDALSTVGLGPEGFGGILRLALLKRIVFEADGLVTMSSRIRSREGGYV
ncbi:hypothetical protein SAMN05428995_1129 [Loktanella sp. DSM 29012]|uniref:hypothetical protein n=1 Tax=Loktanella sp. DSM 29012 TaxID=1881056 RepID=UPI0008C5F13E|nr:hypothetical protein [Loktanella sp. DSM 29012]SEQ86687.1 hypothetical protein SAMN05428995_1129 [Loktanella sp. DSM 29012]